MEKCKRGDWISYHLFVVFWSVVPVLFEYTLAPKKHIAKTPDALAVADVVTEMESPPSSVEVALALRVLEGCCLLYSACRTTASHHSAVSVRLWSLLFLVKLAFRFTTVLLHFWSSNHYSGMSAHLCGRNDVLCERTVFALVVAFHELVRSPCSCLTVRCWDAGTSWLLFSWRDIYTKHVSGWFTGSYAGLVVQSKGLLLPLTDTW